MDQHLADLINAGAITYEAALEKAHDVDGLNRLMQRGEGRTEASGRTTSSAAIDFGDSFSSGAK